MTRLAPRLDRFLAFAEARIASRAAPRTRAIYEADFARWRAHCEAAGVKLDDPPQAAGPTYRNLLQETLAPLSVRRILAALSSIYRRAVAQRPQLATWNPFDPDTLEWPSSVDFSKTEAVPVEVAERMIAAAEADPTVFGRRDAAVLRLLYDTGLRRMSVAGLRRACLLREGSVARVFVKGQKEGEVVLPDSSRLALARWLAVAPKGEYVFAARGRKSASRSIDVATINKIVTNRAAEVGSPGVHPHQFRATFITSAYDGGVNEHDIQAAAHHSDPRSTQRYDRGRRGFGVTDVVAKQRQIRKEP